MTFKYHMCIELPKKLPPRRATDHAIELEPGARPPAQAPYRMAPVELVELRKQLDELLEAGLVQPSKAPYGSPVLFQRKQDGSMRMCVDYLALNTHLRAVFQRLREYELYAKKEKCEFCCEQITFLGHVISQGKIQMDRKKAVHQGLLENCKPLKGFAEERSEVDASDRALGGVLVQDKHYIAFESRKLKDAELRYSTHEKEMTAVIYCLEAWRHYLLGTKLTAVTDNVANKYFKMQRKPSPKQARWQEFLGEFDFEWVHRPGKHNDVANALSRKLIEEWTGVCANGTLRRRLFREIHDPQWAGHPGIDRMVALLARRYYWPRMEEDVEAYVRTCLVCQLDKVERKEKAGLLQPLSIPEYGIFIDAPHACSAETAAELLFKNVTKYFGVPKDILPMVAQRRMKKYADMGRRHVEFGAGDQMLLKLTPQIWKKISSKSVHRGLIPKYDGPFEVMSKVGSLAYRLKLPDHLKIHPTFHEFEKTVLKILDHRMIGQSKNRRTDYLVHWSGESEADATWEQDVTLWQFEEKLDEYWACTSGRGTVSAWSDTVMDSQTDGRSGCQAAVCVGRQRTARRRAWQMCALNSLA
ncbi:hypothetical protein Sango_3049900 [Sesamum angolense]|uniref:Chromo domain-containing protein n=1 Tax=Sesamum angolense TaxID=2727404 RepID=A0AAE1TAT2_9LAMI|nr:hypothetical protein Sango_3049900 [Sesamum angolense]